MRTTSRMVALLVIAGCTLAASSAWADESTASAATKADLEKSEEEDSGLGLEWVWFNAEAGISYLDLTSFSESNLAIQTEHSSGPMFGFAGGVRLLFLTLGVRARHYALADFGFWEVDGDVGLHVKIWRIDPYLALRGGYAFSGSLGNAPIAGSDNPTVHGFNAALAVGGDYYFSQLVSLGADLSGDLLFLQRPPIAIPGNVPPAERQAIQANPLYSQTGTSAGAGLTASIHLGIHF